MSDYDYADEEKEEIKINGQDVLQVLAKNVSMIATRLGAKIDFKLGPNEDWEIRYRESEDMDEDWEEDRLELRDPAVGTVLRLPVSHETFEIERLSLVPEYDSIEEIPEIRPDDHRYDEEYYENVLGETYDPDTDESLVDYNPRNIVRLSSDAVDGDQIESAGIYTYSLEELEWIRMDAPAT